MSLIEFEISPNVAQLNSPMLPQLHKVTINHFLQYLHSHLVTAAVLSSFSLSSLQFRSLVRFQRGKSCASHVHFMLLNEVSNFKTMTKEYITDLQSKKLWYPLSLKNNLNATLKSLVTKKNNLNPLFLSFLPSMKKSQSKPTFKVQRHRWRYRKTSFQQVLHLGETAQGCQGQFNTEIDYSKVFWEDIWALFLFLNKKINKNQVPQAQLQFSLLGAYLSHYLSAILN